MKVSIIVPAFNSGRFILKCLNSIREQTFRDFECIIIDDGSIDNTVEACKRFIKSDNRFKLLELEHKGVSAARNAGLEIAQGELISFVDSDDFIEKSFLYKLVMSYSQTTARIVSCNYYENIKNIDYKHICSYEYKEYNIRENKSLPKGFFAIWNKIYDAKLLREHNIRFFEGVHYGEDSLFNYECLIHSGKIQMIADILYHRVMRDDSLSKDNIKSTLSNGYRLLKKKLLDENINYSFHYDNKIEEKLRTIDVESELLMNEKIDYVVPYVDCSNEDWQTIYKHNFPNVEVDFERFKPDLSFKYVFRSIEKYAPWINKINLIVQSDSQVPEWINRDEVNIVLHKDFIPEEYLPTFNSECIEAWLDKIPNLTDRFIYGNDDMLFASDTSKLDFFAANLQPNIELHTVVKKKDFCEKCKRSYRRVCDRLNKAMGPKTQPNHNILPIVKADYDQAREVYGSYIRYNFSKLRHSESNPYFVTYYEYATDKCKKANFVEDGYFECKTEEEFSKLKNIFTKKSRKCLTVNRNTYNEGRDLMELLESIFPEKSKYEL